MPPVAHYYPAPPVVHYYPAQPVVEYYTAPPVVEYYPAPAPMPANGFSVSATMSQPGFALGVSIGDNW